MPPRSVRNGMAASIGAPSQEAPTLASRRLRLTFPESLIREPVISGLVSRFDLVVNIRRADVRETAGWVVLEVTGDADAIDEGIVHLDRIGIRVDDVESYLE